MGASSALAVVPERDDGTNGITHLATVKPHELLPPIEAWRQMREMADDIFKSGLMPSSIKNAAGTLAVMLKGRELGIPAMAAIEGISIVQGKPTCSAHLLLALIKRDYGAGAIRVAATTATECTVEWREHGWSGVRSFNYTIEDAGRAKLLGKDTWQQYPAAMLRARCISAVAKLAFPECVGGMMIAEELGGAVVVTDDGDVVPDVSPTPTTQTAGVVDAEFRDAALPAQRREVPTIGSPLDWSGFWKWARGELGLDGPSAVEALIGVSLAGMSPAEVRDQILATKGGEGPNEAYANGAPAEGISIPQTRKLWATAREKLGDDADAAVHAVARQNFGVDSITELSRGNAHNLIDFFVANDGDALQEMVGPMLRQAVIDAGQTELPAAGADPIDEAEAALIAFRERAEAAVTKEDWDALFHDADGDPERWVAIVGAVTLVRRLNYVVGAAKRHGMFAGLVEATVAARRAVLTEYGG